MRDKKLFGGLGKADVPCGGFKGSDRIQGWKFSHTPILPKLCISCLDVSFTRHL
jgi:hypothetical protein